MKKTLAIITFLLLTLIANAQIKFHGNFEAGYESRLTSITWYSLHTYIYDNNEPGFSFYLPNDRGNELKAYYATFDMSSEYKNFTLYANNRTYFKFSNISSYSPEYIQFTLGLKYEYKKIAVSYEHMCGHSIDILRFNDAYDRFSLRIKLF